MAASICVELMGQIPVGRWRHFPCQDPGASLSAHSANDARFHDMYST